MDFGTGFITKNIMLPILDFFFQFFHSYGLSIALLTIVVRFALYPLGARSIRSMRKMQAVQPLLAKKTEEIKKKHADDPQELQKAQMELYKELGVNPFGGCLPLLAQMPVFIALFATLQGTPFADQKYQLNIHVVPATQQLETKNQTSVHNIYLDAKTHIPVLVRPSEVNLPVGQSFQFQVLKEDGQPFTDQPGGRAIYWKVLSGGENVELVGESFRAKKEGTALVAAEVPGIAANDGFLFIQALGRSGLTGPDGAFHWDIALMILLFGGTLWLSTEVSSRNNPAMTDQQKQIGRFTPVIVVGSFLFFPLPAGVFIYMIVSNMFQLTQTYLLYREPLPEEIQRLQEELVLANQSRAPMPFEKKQRRKRKK
ncbi:membrane protein insertase YidC [Anthocerotibacter panamensis]|uniref:membrane protein insertase YidC n=1 Tax=Anthocerotibacter panamensis TaxID=2857077 RepID=UPI001C405896|nr:membrane protein insertase YidC [Anthocerotibacter panamensis]